MNIIKNTNHLCIAVYPFGKPIEKLGRKPYFFSAFSYLSGSFVKGGRGV